MKVQITLKSGVQLNVEATEITKTHNQITGELTGLEWTSIDGRPALFTITLHEVAAIVVTKDPEPAS